ncbi:TonB-dependent siderophore receptor [Leisingera sp.]|uniref:TonB-dependent receptor n=1 Tax=Leisingera sp. TaxID=1879318 RepID=UPI002B264B33|nr:TonB-dependent siderophore receptor [Leisingera sp.]
MRTPDFKPAALCVMPVTLSLGFSRPSCFLTFAASAMLVSAPIPAAAQELELEPVQLEPISVKKQFLEPGLDLELPSNAGSRLGLSSRETPASVQVISEDTIRQRSQRDVNQAIVQNGTGISFNGRPSNGGTTLSMRGFSGHSSVTRLYDGTRLYPAPGTISFPFDTWNVDSIEVLNGPASVLYGEGGVGGAINIIPKKPLTDTTRNELRTTVGTNGQLGLALGSAGPISDRLAYSFDVSRTRSDGRVDGDDPSSLAVSAALRWQATNTLALSLSHDYGDNTPSIYFGTPLKDGRIDEGVRERNYNAEDALVRFKDRYTQLRAEWTPSRNLTVSSNSYYLTSKRDWRNIEDYTYQPGTGDVARKWYIAVNHDLEQAGNRTAVTFDSLLGGINTSTTVGAEVNRITYKNTNNSPYAGSSVVDYQHPVSGSFGPHSLVTTADLTTDQQAVFADSRLEINDQWSIVGGLRYDHLRVRRVDPAFTKKFNSLNWRIGTVYNPLPDMAIYAQYSRAAEPIGSVLSLSESQSQLELTKARQQEIGVKFSFLDGRGNATLSAYNIVKNDLLARDPADPSIVRQIGQQSSKGIEFATGLDISPVFRIDVNGALISPEYDNYIQSGGDLSGNRPALVPRRVANIWAQWEFSQNWTARAGAHYVGEVFTDSANSSTLPAYTVLNAGLQWRPRENISLDFSVYNAADRLYATSGSSNQWLLAPPRSATIDLHITF